MAKKSMQDPLLAALSEPSGNDPAGPMSPPMAGPEVEGGGAHSHPEYEARLAALEEAIGPKKRQATPKAAAPAAPEMAEPAAAPAL